MNNILETEDLTKWYGSSKVVDGVKITIEPGEIYSLIGKNGAGKTTIMKLVLSMIKPSDGIVKLFGEGTSTNVNLHRLPVVNNVTGASILTSDSVMQFSFLIMIGINALILIFIPIFTDELTLKIILSIPCFITSLLVADFLALVIKNEIMICLAYYYRYIQVFAFLVFAGCNETNSIISAFILPVQMEKLFCQKLTVYNGVITMLSGVIYCVVTYLLLKSQLDKKATYESLKTT